MEPTELCENCSDIPFIKLHDGLLRQKWPPLSFVLGALSDILARTCPMCRLVSTAVLARTRRPNRPSEAIKVNWNPFDHYFSIPAAAASVRFLSGEVASGEYAAGGLIDPTLINNWLMTCKSKHGEKCQSPPPDANTDHGSFRMIDLRSMCIVDSSILPEFVALSYVWGRAPTLRLLAENKSDLMKPGGLLAYWDQVPLTIRDAVTLVGMLGLQYLWVDSLCLVQDDKADMEGGIKAMDTVYEQALFTIIAADGSDARHGLPGISSDTRPTVQKICEVVSGICLAVSQNVRELLKATSYQTRAWTNSGYHAAKSCLLAI
ncbi:hypothetical protein LCI18_013937 [Fusarium solani-melongenae]|uniref:Uncharacterized protein n=1 Tax=Fusarium solani subsp. cucurbitae TaxID=2747967 RepID=A0ACD3ZPX4_FUSSC|nr:hypothetical protein LCI18_013937 [Fusarium solani-melongenae]